MEQLVPGTDTTLAALGESKRSDAQNSLFLQCCHYFECHSRKGILVVISMYL